MYPNQSRLDDLRSRFTSLDEMEHIEYHNLREDKYYWEQAGSPEMWEEEAA